MSKGWTHTELVGHREDSRSSAGRVGAKRRIETKRSLDFDTLSLLTQRSLPQYSHTSRDGEMRRQGDSERRGKRQSVKNERDTRP
jgi:hypothetical protein